MDQPSSRSRAKRAALISLIVALGLVAAKLAAATVSGSLAFLSLAADSALDAAASGITYFAVRIASRPPDREHPYGHGKAENISALVTTLVLLALSVLIAVTAFGRLDRGGSSIDAGWYTFGVILVSIVVDASRARILRKVGREVRSAALEADALHFSADLVTSVVVLIALASTRLGFAQADAIGGLLIASYVGYSSIRLGRRSIDVLMDRAPAGAVERISQAAAQVHGVEEVRRVRVRNVGGHDHADVVIAISRRVPLETAHHVTEEVERAIRLQEPGADVVVHVEPLANEALIAEQVEAIAAREPSVGQIHNIFVSSHPEGHRISLHAKFPGEMTLAEAHSISERLERQIAAEIPNVERVDTHLEPLESSAAIGVDVTYRYKDLAAQSAEAARSQPEVMNCHEVVVTETEGALTVLMHCEASPGLHIDAVHEASTRIENDIHQRFPDVKRVTVHFEPALNS